MAQSLNKNSVGYLLGLLAVTTFQTDAVSAADGSPALEIEEIVVTARKREENMQSVPVAVSVLTGRDMVEQGGMKVDVVGQMAPNVHFEAAGGTSGVKSPVIFIRGMGQNDFIPVEDPAVGIYLDGVYMGRNIGSVFDLIDIERVEVLRGPQGTLFGRNTIGGAVNIISTKPHGDTVEGALKLSVGSDDYRELNATVNVPISDNVSGRFSAFMRERDGYVEALQYDNVELGSDDIWGIRARIAADVTDNFSIDFAADYTKSEETPGAITPIGGISGFNGSVITQGLPVNPFTHFWNAIWSGDPGSCTTGAGQATNTACYGPVWNTGDMYETNSVFVDRDGNQIKPEQSVEVQGANLTMTWDLDNVQIKSITAYREFDIDLVNDLDFSPYILFANNHDTYVQDQLSQEIQISGDAMEGRLNYVVGFYYFEEDGHEAIPNQISFAPPLSGPPDFFFQYLDRFIDNDSTAVFGQINYDLTDEITLTLGARRTESNKDFNLLTQRRVGPLNDQFGKLTTKETTPLASLAWDVNDDVMLYATYSEGYRDGSYAARFTGAVPTPLPNYDPEFVDNFEVGMKSRLLDRRMRLNVSAFRMDYEDMQINASSDVVATSSTKANLGDATIQGLEIEMLTLVNENFTLGANIGYLDDEIDSLKGVLVSNTVVIGENNDLPNTPDWTLSLMAKYEMQLSSGASINLRADFAMKDDYYSRAENLVENLNDDYKNLNLTGTYITADGSWEATAGVRNATDEEYYQSATPFATFGLVFGQPVRPRTAYFSLQYNIGSR
ncbi:MAG: TonB-dependent receptor [Pseudomonadales bacterium]